tara:strand:- start:694 stop:3531 length:2838 start_codon:yes stop_codon:yes gene_type:complete
MHILKFVILFIFSSFIFSQDYDPMQGGYIRGGVIDDITELPKPHANISIVKADSDKIVQGGVADEEGLFFIDKIPYGIYYVVVEYVGYQDYIIDDVKIYPTHLEINLETIRLVSKALILEGVEVVEQMPIIEDIAKTTYPVAETARAEGGSADDVLEKLPSVSIDVDGNIALRGNSNVTILIDGRKSKINVDMINANMIEKVEVMTTPSSKYDPDGIAGIINIVLNKNQYLGKSGNVGINIDDKESINFSGSLNSFNNDWNIFGSYSIKSKNKEGGGYRNTWLKYDDILENNTSNSNTSNKDRDNANIKLGFERYFENNDLLAFDITFLKKKSTHVEKNFLEINFIDHDGVCTYDDWDNNPNSPDSGQCTESDDQSKIGNSCIYNYECDSSYINSWNDYNSLDYKNVSESSLYEKEEEGNNVNFGVGYFRTNENKGAEFSIQFDYEDNDDKHSIIQTLDKVIDCSLFNNDSECEEEAPYCSWDANSSTCSYSSIIINEDESSNNSMKVISMDYSAPFSKDNDEEYYEVGFKVNSDIENHNIDYEKEPFNYNSDNKIAAAYLTTTFGITDKLDMQAGVRLEHQKKNTNLIYDDVDCALLDYSQCSTETAFCQWTGDSSTGTCSESEYKWALDQVENKDYTYEHEEGIRVFPTLYFIFDLDESGKLKFSSGRRINRPFYRNLNPIPDMDDAYTDGIKFINVGNPTLKPEDIKKLELEYSNKVSIGGFPIGFMKTSAYYEDIIDQIDRDKDTEFYNNEVYQILSWKNNTRSRKVGYELFFASKMQKFSMMFNGNWWNTKTWGAAGADGLGTSHGFWGMLVGELKLKNDQTISMYSHHSSPMRITTGTIDPFRRMDLTYKKEVNPRFNFTIKLKDVFDTGGFSITTNQAIDYASNLGYMIENLEAESRRDNRTLSVNFEYKFGSFQKKKYKREKDQGYGGDGGGMDMSY